MTTGQGVSIRSATTTDGASLAFRNYYSLAMDEGGGPSSVAGPGSSWAAVIGALSV